MRIATPDHEFTVECTDPDFGSCTIEAITRRGDRLFHFREDGIHPGDAAAARTALLAFADFQADEALVELTGGDSWLRFERLPHGGFVLSYRLCDPALDAVGEGRLELDGEYVGDALRALMVELLPVR
jgi:hypothetical protein